MPGVVSALAASGTPFSILTKGTLLRRDLPLIASAAQDVPVGLAVSLGVHDEGLHRLVEPGTPSPRARLDLVRAVRDAGLPCGVLVAPVLPWLTDGEAEIDTALARLAEAGASGVSLIPLHLRPGAREWFFAWLDREYPELVPRYRQLYRRGAYVPAGYREGLRARVRPLLERHGFGRSGAPDTGVPGDPDSEYPEGSLPRRFGGTGERTASAPGPQILQPTLL
jgi:DNA repair photolyase